MPKDEFSDFRSPEQASFDKMVEALDRAYHRPWAMMWRSFLHGLMSAVGAAVGWILIITLSGYLFQALGGIKLLTPLLDKAQEGIDSAAHKAIQNNSPQDGN